MTEQFSRFEEPVLRHRGKIVALALFFCALTAAFSALFLLGLYMVVNGDTGFLVMLLFGGGCALTLGFLTLQYLRDLGARPVTVEGVIDNKWHKGNPLETFMLLSLIVLVIGAFRVATGTSIPLLVLIAIAGLAFLLGVRIVLPLLADLAIALSERERSSFWTTLLGLALAVFKPSFYILVDGKVYNVTRVEYTMLLEEDRVRITCYPHSLIVERIDRYDTIEKAFVPASSGSLS